MSMLSLPRAFVGVLMLAIVTVTGAASVGAHSDLEGSTPGDGETVLDPVGEITIVFASAASPDADGFEVLDPQGAVRSPDVEQLDERTYVLRVAPPLAGGQAAVRYSMVAADGHALSGGFAFTVDAPVPATTVPATTVPRTTPSTSVPATSAPPTSGSSDSSVPATSPADPVDGSGVVPDVTLARAQPAPAPTQASPTDSGDVDASGLGVDAMGALALAAVGGLGAGAFRWRSRVATG